MRLSRGREYSSWANSTASRASYVLRVRGEDVQDQLRAVEDLDFHGLLEIAGLAGTQVVVEDHHVGRVRVHQTCQLLDLATSQKRRGIRRLTTLRHAARHARAGRGRQAFEFRQGILFKSLVGKNDSDQYRGFAGQTLGPFSFVHSGVQPPSPLLRDSTGVPNITRRLGIAKTSGRVSAPGEPVPPVRRW